MAHQEHSRDTVSRDHYGKDYKELPDDGEEQDWIATNDSQKSPHQIFGPNLGSHILDLYETYKESGDDEILQTIKKYSKHIGEDFSRNRLEARLARRRQASEVRQSAGFNPVPARKATVSLEHLSPSFRTQIEKELSNWISSNPHTDPDTQVWAHRYDVPISEMETLIHVIQTRPSENNVRTMTAVNEESLDPDFEKLCDRALQMKIDDFIETYSHLPKETLIKVVEKTRNLTEDHALGVVERRLVKAQTQTNKITYKLKRKVETDEWMAAAYINGKFDDDKTYYTDDKQDAMDTLKDLQKREDKRVGQTEKSWFKSKTSWDNAVEKLDATEDDTNSVKLDGVLIAQWSPEREEGWIKNKRSAQNAMNPPAQNSYKSPSSPGGSTATPSSPVSSKPKPPKPTVPAPSGMKYFLEPLSNTWILVPASQPLPAGQS